MGYGYTGRILRVDLSTARLWTETPPESFYRRCLGGSGLNLHYLLDEMEPGADPLGPANILAFSTGVPTGARVSGLSRLTISARSPLTGAIGDSQSGGFFPAALKFAGFDAVIVAGASPAPVYLFIDGGEAELRDGSRLWGRPTDEAEAVIRDELGGQDDIHVLQIGPAGERLVRYACILSMCSRANGRTGMGAVMGSKQLKAIAVRGDREVEIADPEALAAVVRTGAELFKKPANKGFGRYGTAGVLGVNDGAGGLPTRNWQSGTFGGAAALDGPTLYDTALRGAVEGRQESRGRDTCFSCIVRCKRVVQLDGGAYPVDPVFGGPEYETLAALGSYCGVSDLEAVCKAGELCNRYGLDTISTGATISWAMEAFEAGRLGTDRTGGLEIRFGQGDTVVRLIEMIAARDGFGDLLAEGSQRAAERLGIGREFLTTSKGQEAPAHMPQVKRGLALLYAMNPFGADHMGCDHDGGYTEQGYRAFAERLSYLGLTTPVASDSLAAEKVEFVRRTQHLCSFMDSANFCQLCWGATWTLYGPQDMIALIRAVTGWDMDIEEALEVGERRLNMMKLFNEREGFGRADDALPERFFEQPLTGGPSAGMTVDREEFERALKLYYRQSGWDEQTGRPTGATLERFGLNR